MGDAQRYEHRIGQSELITAAERDFQGVHLVSLAQLVPYGKSAQYPYCGTPLTKRSSLLTTLLPSSLC
jgi:hypothetical protein